MKLFTKFFGSLLTLLGIGIGASGQCPAGEINVIAEITTDSWGYEVYWEVTPDTDTCGASTSFGSFGNPAVGCNGGGAQVAGPGPGAYPNGMTFTDTVGCIPASFTNCYSIHSRDDWGDGGTSFKIYGDVAYNVLGEFNTSAGNNTFNFCATPPPDYNAAISLSSKSMWYTAVPCSQGLILEAAIANQGQNALTNVDVKVVITDTSGTVVHTNNSGSAPLAIAAEEVRGFFNPHIFSGSVAPYIMTFNVTEDETDGKTSNDTIVKVINITDSVMAFDFGSFSTALGLNNDTALRDVKMGQSFWTNNNDTLTSISAIFVDPNMGDSTRYSVWQMAGDTPSVQIGMSANYIYGAADTGNLFLTLPLISPIPFNAGEEYAIVAHQLSENNMALAASGAAYHAGLTWVKWNTLSNWGNIEDLGFQVTFLLRANFGSGATCLASSPVVTVDELVLSTKVLVYPNPTNGKATIDLGDVHSNVSLNLYDINGSLVSSTVESGRIINLDYSSVAEGVYFLDILSNDIKSTVRIIKN